MAVDSETGKEEVRVRLETGEGELTGWLQTQRSKKMGIHLEVVDQCLCGFYLGISKKGITGQQGKKT